MELVVPVLLAGLQYSLLQQPLHRELGLVAGSPARDHGSCCPFAYPALRSVGNCDGCQQNDVQQQNGSDSVGPRT